MATLAHLCKGIVEDGLVGDDVEEGDARLVEGQYVVGGLAGGLGLATDLKT